MFGLDNRYPAPVKGAEKIAKLSNKNHNHQILSHYFPLPCTKSENCA